MSSKNQKRQRLITLIFVNTIQYLRTLKINIYHLNKQGPPTFFHPDTNPVIGHGLVHSVDKSHVLVVTVELIWLLLLNMLSFNFVPTPRKSLKFKKFRRSYVNRPVVVLTNHCQSYTVFWLDVRCSKWPSSYFCSCLFRMIMQLRFWARLFQMLLTPSWVQANKCELVINISNLTVGVEHSIGLRATFSPNLHSVEEEALECLLILQD